MKLFRNFLILPGVLKAPPTKWHNILFSRGLMLGGFIFTNSCCHKCFFWHCVNDFHSFYGNLTLTLSLLQTASLKFKDLHSEDLQIGLKFWVTQFCSLTSRRSSLHQLKLLWVTLFFFSLYPSILRSPLEPPVVVAKQFRILFFAFPGEASGASNRKCNLFLANCFPCWQPGFH